MPKRQRASHLIACTIRRLMVSTRLPGPRGLLGRNHLLFLRRDPETFRALARKYGDVVYFRIGTRDVFLVSHPALIEQIFRDHYAFFEKDWGPRRGSSVFRNGLLTSEGDEHRAQRQQMAALFSRSRLDAQIPAVAAIIHSWSRKQRDGAAVDVFEQMWLLSIEIAFRVLFGSTVDPVQVRQAVDPVTRAFRRFMFPYADRIRIRRDRRRKIQQVLKDMLSRHDPARDQALLAPLTEDDEQMATFFVAGQETIRIATSWTWFLLSSHPEAAAKLISEARQPVPSDGSQSALPFATAVLMESMRLYPPQWMIGRRPIAPYTLDGHSLPIGALVLMSPYVVQRDERFFADSDKFVPERWLGPDGRPALRYAYFPFGGGARRCIGESFAMIVATAMLSMIARDWIFDCDESGGAFDPRLTLAPRSMPARIRAVSGQAPGTRT